MAKPGTGDTVSGIGNKAGDLANKAIEGLADGYEKDSLEATAIGLDGLGGLTGQSLIEIIFWIS